MRIVIITIIAAGLVASAIGVPSSSLSNGETEGPITYQSGLPPGMTSSQANALVATGNLPYTVGPDGVKTYTLPNPAMQSQQAPANSDNSQASASSPSTGSSQNPTATTSSST